MSTSFKVQRKPLLIDVRDQKQLQQQQEKSQGNLTDRSTNNTSGNLGILRYKERFSEEQVQLQARVRDVFNQIGDLNDKLQIQSAMKSLETKEERSILIDKILKRKQEKLNADEIMRMSKVQPLLQRFVRKLKKPPLEFYENTPQKTNSTNSNNFDKITQFDGSAPDSRRPSVLTPDETDGALTPSKKNSEASELENRAKFLSIFLNNKKKKEEPKKDDKINSISSVCEVLMGKSDNLGKKINLNKVSDDSSDLITRGKEMQRLKAIELLREGQKINLSSHFKSYTLRNRYNTSAFEKWTNDPNINTFHAEIDEQDLKIEAQKMKNFVNYQNHLDATKIVESDINAFIAHHSTGNALDFVMIPSSIRDPTTRAIENRIRQVQEKNVELLPIKKNQTRTPSVDSKTKWNSRQSSNAHSRYPSQNLKLQEDKGAPVSLASILDNSQTPSSIQAHLLKENKAQIMLHSPYFQNSENYNYEINDNIVVPLFQSNMSRDNNNSPTKNINNNSLVKNNNKSYNNQQLPMYIHARNAVGKQSIEITNSKREQTSSSQKLRIQQRQTKQKKPISLFTNGSFTDKMQDIITTARSTETNSKEFHSKNLESNYDSGGISDRIHRKTPSSFLAPMTAAAHTQRNSSSCASFNFNYDLHQACCDQRDKTGVEKKKYFAYDGDNQYLMKNRTNSTSNILCSDYLRTAKKMTQESPQNRIKNDEFMHTLENNKLLNHALKNIKTVDKWKLLGDIKCAGKNDEVTKDEDKDDESLVSFTEIKLDKMYKKTLTLQNNQRMIEKEKEEIHAQGKDDTIIAVNSDKTLNHLDQIKRDVLRATQTKLRQYKRHTNMS